MKKDFDNLKFWTERSESPEFTTVSVTDNDIHRRDLENHFIKENLTLEDNVIDIGCGTGYGTKQYASKVNSIVGSDFTENMIKRAIDDSKGINNLSYEVGDIVFNKSSKKYNTAITQRCLINILDPEKQYKAIENIYNLLEDGGKYIMCEGSYNGREELNLDRLKLGLDRQPDLEFNINFDDYKLNRFLNERFTLVKEINFGFYDFFSRVAYPFISDIVEYDSEVNRNLKSLLIKNINLSDKYRKYDRCGIKILKKKN